MLLWSLNLPKTYSYSRSNVCCNERAIIIMLSDDSWRKKINISASRSYSIINNRKNGSRHLKNLKTYASILASLSFGYFIFNFYKGNFTYALLMSVCEFWASMWKSKKVFQSQEEKYPRGLTKIKLQHYYIHLLDMIFLYRLISNGTFYR